MFFYELAHKPSRTLNEWYGKETGADKEDFGVAHGDDLLALFKLPGLKGAISTEEDEKVADQITTMFTNFAKHGDPTPYQDGDLITWEPFDVRIPLKDTYLDFIFCFFYSVAGGTLLLFFA